MDLFQKVKDFTIIKELKEKNIYPYFHQLETKQAPVVKMENHEVLMFGSNNYLGLTSNQDIINDTIKALEKYGTGVSGSRFLNGTLDLHKVLEKEMAEFLNKEQACLFSTGFQANLGIISAILQRHDLVFCDKENHASIYDGIKLSGAKMIRYNHNDMEDLELRLKEADPDKAKLIITDGVFSMTGDIANIPKIVELKKKYNARLMIDDAHGFGTIGKNGRGTASHFNLESEADLIMGTFSKSLASIGGYLVADKDVCDYVIHNSRPYIFSAALTPANTQAALSALYTLKNNPNLVDTLLDNTRYMQEVLEKEGILFKKADTPIIPIYTYKKIRTMVLCNLLFEKGVYVNPVLPPATPEGECLIRVSLMATHTKQHIEKAAKIIKECLLLTKDIEEDI